MKLKKFKKIKKPAALAAKAPPKKSKSEAPPLKLRQVDTASKIPVSIRLDEEIVAFFKAEHPKGYQSAINQVLLDHVTENS